MEQINTCVSECNISNENLRPQAAFAYNRARETCLGHWPRAVQRPANVPQRPANVFSVPLTKRHNG